MNKKYTAMVVGVLVVALIVGYMAWKKAEAPQNVDLAENGPYQEYKNVSDSALEAKGAKTAAFAKGGDEKQGLIYGGKQDENGRWLIIYTDKGFDPFTLEIKKGQPVRFINLSSRAMRISGEIRGVESYRGSEQSTSLGKGGFYDFAFTQKGVWGYKNLNNENDRGVVVVTD